MTKMAGKLEKFDLEKVPKKAGKFGQIMTGFVKKLLTSLGLTHRPYGSQRGVQIRRILRHLRKRYVFA